MGRPPKPRQNEPEITQALEVLGAQLKELRHASGKTQLDLVSQGLSPQIVVAIENGSKGYEVRSLIKYLNAINPHFKINIMAQNGIKLKSFNKSKAVFDIEFQDDASQNESIPVASNWREIATIPTEAEWKNRQYATTARRALKEAREDPRDLHFSNFPKDGDLEWTSNTPVPVVVFARDREDAQKAYDSYGIKDFSLKSL